MTEDDDRRTALEVLRSSRILAYTIGFLCLAAGLVLLFWPDRTIVVVARIAGILLAAVGLSEIVDSISNHRDGDYWGFLLLRGVLNAAAGVLLLFWPGVTVTVLVWLFGLDLILTGIIGLLVSRRVPSDHGRSSIVFRSIVGIAVGFVVVAWPDVTLAVLALLVALQLLAIGGILLWSGYQLTRVARQV